MCSFFDTSFGVERNITTIVHFDNATNIGIIRFMFTSSMTLAGLM